MPLLIGVNSDLHDVLRSNWPTGFSLGTSFLDIGKTVSQNSAVLEIYLPEKEFIEAECNLVTVGNGEKSALYDFVN